MECQCGGVLIEGKSCYRVSEEYFCLILNDLPAFKCTRCGKVLFKDDTVEKVKRLVSKIKKDSAEIVTGTPSANLYDY